MLSRNRYKDEVRADNLIIIGLTAATIVGVTAILNFFLGCKPTGNEKIFFSSIMIYCLFISIMAVKVKLLVRNGMAVTVGNFFDMTRTTRLELIQVVERSK